MLLSHRNLFRWHKIGACRLDHAGIQDWYGACVQRRECLNISCCGARRSRSTRLRPSAAQGLDAEGPLELLRFGRSRNSCYMTWLSESSCVAGRADSSGIAISVEMPFIPASCTVPQPHAYWTYQQPCIKHAVSLPNQWLQKTP